MNKAIQIENLTKKYNNTVAINNITLSLEQNKIYGLLGRNGAGKTTLLHLLSGQLLPTQGSIYVLGENIRENAEALAKICYIGSFSHLQNYVKTFRVRDLLKIAGKFYPYWDQVYADYLVKSFYLDIKKPYKSLSAGMLSMVSIIISLASRAPVTLLDEPYTGLDAAVRQQFYNILAEDFGQNPRTIIFSTHLIDEASRLFQDIILLDRGQVLLHDTAESLEESSFVVSGEENSLRHLLNRKRIIHKESIGRRAAYFLFDKLSEEERKELLRSGLELRSLTLQQLFVYLTDREEETKC
jgi:ABC-2 type transport system ATP-binding protein